MTTTIEPSELAWRNSICITVMQACLGKIGPGMKAVRVEFLPERKFTIHFYLGSRDSILLEDAEKIVVEAIAYLGPEYAGIGLETHYGRYDPTVDKIQNAWIFVAK